MATEEYESETQHDGDDSSHYHGRLGPLNLWLGRYRGATGSSLYVELGLLETATTGKSENNQERI